MAAVDRGALILCRDPTREYRGTHRTPLDGVAFRGRRGRDLGRRYAEALVDGEGVLQDLDQALALCAEATALGIPSLEVIVFEVPQRPAGPLAVLEPPPAEGLELLGWDVFEPLEPWWSPLSSGAVEGLNACGLFARREDAEALARRLNDDGATDEPAEAVRVWKALPG
ncbi:MAG: hypothetical protein HY909_11360 [Deltaproteobacteria bacterium]|nr:hypothetical protein [Deltaproteobacteria bacterium]